MGLFAKGVQRPLRTVWKVKSGYRTVSYWWPKEVHSECSGKAYSETKSNKVLLMVPGNPGLPEYYIEFLSLVHEKLGTEFDIVLVGHHGQSVDEFDSDYPEKNFGLQHQVQHKLECLDALAERYPANTEYFLVGHSVGAWICEQLVKKRPDMKITQTFSLFPALRKLRETQNGSWMNQLLFPPVSRNIIGKLVWGINLLPMHFMIRTISTLAKQSLKNALITSLMFLKPSVIESVLVMAHDEMEQIYEVDKDFYIENSEKFTIYYGVGDKWVPVESYHEMKDSVLSENIFLCSDNLPHAFVLEHSSDMANKMVGWLEKYI